MLKLLFIEVLDGTFKTLFCIGDARVWEKETEAESARTKHVPDAKAGGARPELEQNVIETSYHIGEFLL